MSGNKGNKMCVYCGSQEEITKDHVPPKAIFKKPYPSNMITVPACKQCHDEMSINDEYFLIALGFALSSDETKYAKYVTEKVKRALQRPEAMKLKTDLSTRVRDLEVYSGAGIYLGDSKGINFDWSRLKLFARRVLRALYFVEHGVPLNNEFQLDVYLSWFQKDSEVLSSPEIKELLQVLARSAPTIVGENTFQYWHTKAEDESASSVWYVRLAEEFGFFGFILPEIELTDKASGTSLLRSRPFFRR